jgi:hypothetical protein
MNRFLRLSLTVILTLTGFSVGVEAAESGLRKLPATNAGGHLRLGLRDWAVSDGLGASPPSSWYISEGVIKQTENTIVNNKKALKPDPTLEREGTMFVYQPGMEFGDGEISLDIFCTDDDGVGVAFKWTGVSKYNLWYMDGQRHYRTLAVKNEFSYEALESNRRGVEMRRWYPVRIVMEGPKITVFVNGQKEFETYDGTHKKGTIALFCWGNSGTLFRDLKFVAAKKKAVTESPETAKPRKALK